MDVVISQYDGTYIEALNRYNKALQQRNSMLKADNEPDDTLIGLLEEQMAEQGEIVYHKRDSFIKELTPLFQDFTAAFRRKKKALRCAMCRTASVGRCST